MTPYSRRAPASWIARMILGDSKHQGRPLSRFQGLPTILLVNRDDTLRGLEKTVIASRGFRVLTAKDGREAMSLFRRFHSEISLVFSDLILPTVGGENLLRGMQKIDPHVRVLFSSAYLDVELRANLMRAGAAECIQKPMASEEILEKIRDILNR